jgi:SAM-dependent methyltransferase
MDTNAYQVMAHVERNHWWFRGRRKILAGLLSELSPPLPNGARVLDVGCGTGANGPVLAQAGRFTAGIDFSALPLELDRGNDRCHAARVQGDAERLPFCGEAFDLVVSLDVLEHLKDDRLGARELRRVVRPGGVIVVFVPALNILWGLQDEVSHHLRRYTRRQLLEVLTSAELRIERLTYFNTILFLPILAARLALRIYTPSTLRTENEVGGRRTNALLTGLFGLEPPILAHTNLPVGVSLGCVARR